ncbi:hypothetical protein ABPG74_012307 [Tetrahymena malaccensis]
MGNYTDFKCNSFSTGSYEQRKSMNSFVLNLLHNGRESNIYQQLNYLLSNPYNQITDLYIWSDGIITEGTSNINDFVNLIKETNSQRRNNILINTISFLVGGNEPQSVRDNATQILKTLANVTGGTFIQVSPSKKMIYNDLIGYLNLKIKNLFSYNNNNNNDNTTSLKSQKFYLSYFIYIHFKIYILIKDLYF